MDEFNKNGKTRVETATNDFLKEGKNLASAIYEDGKDKINEAEDCIKEYSDEVLATVQKNPLTSVLVAAGLGFLLSALFRK